MVDPANDRGRLMYLVQSSVNMPAAIRHCRDMGLPATPLRDENVVIKTVLAECFSGPELRPWAVLSKHGTTVTIAGYSSRPATDLSARRAMALPSLQQAVRDPIGTYVPRFEVGQRLRFRTRLVPTLHMRVDGRTMTRDAFLVAVERSEDKTADREEVYAGYMRERLQGAEISEVGLRNFLLARVARRRKGDGSGWRQHHAPVAQMEGSLAVTDPTAFSACLSAGLGRQRAYGYGFVWLRFLD